MNCFKRESQPDNVTISCLVETDENLLRDNAPSSWRIKSDQDCRSNNHFIEIPEDRSMENVKH